MSEQTRKLALLLREALEANANDWLAEEREGSLEESQIVLIAGFLDALESQPGGARAAKQGLGFSCADCGHQCFHGGAREEGTTPALMLEIREFMAQGFPFDGNTDAVLKELGDAVSLLGRAAAALSARPPREDERVADLVTKVQLLLDLYVECGNDNLFCFPDGEMWDVHPTARPPQQEPSPDLRAARGMALVTGQSEEYWLEQLARHRSLLAGGPPLKEETTQSVGEA